MAAIVYSKRQLIERIVKHMNSNFPGDDWKATDNEVLLYIDSLIPGVMKGQMFELAKVTGFLETIEAYLVTYNYTISTQNANTYEWYVTLAQPPLALPVGYNIPNVYIASPSTGRSQNAYPISTKRKAYRNNMPKPSGFFYRVEGQTMLLEAADGGSLLGYSLFVQMPISRTADLDAAMSMPDDAIEMIFDKVVAKIAQREQLPQDIVKDGLEQGNKAS